MDELHMHICLPWWLQCSGASDAMEHADGNSSGAASNVLML